MSTRHTSCTITRTFVRKTYSFVDLKTPISAETVTEPCATPLFSEDEATTGVCRSCARGWEVPNNRFANEAERERALKVGGKTCG